MAATAMDRNIILFLPSLGRSMAWCHLSERKPGTSTPTRTPTLYMLWPRSRITWRQVEVGPPTCPLPPSHTRENSDTTVDSNREVSNT